MESSYLTTVSSPLGALSIVWQETPEGPKVSRLLLPSEEIPVEVVLGTASIEVRQSSCSPITKLREQLQSSLQGEAVDFDLNLITLEKCSEFQKRVLLQQYKVPRGQVSTYSGIARSLGAPKAARAVGTALARNPFPIIIPCHRTIRSNGELGGFGGGINMKRVLLKLEGVAFSATGRVLTSRFYR